jgi:hypothetical protein
VPEGQRPRLARAFAQAIGGLDGLQVVGFGRVCCVHKGQQGAQLGEHHRPSGMDPAALETEPESLQLVVVFVLYGSRWGQSRYFVGIVMSHSKRLDCLTM